MLLHRSCSSRCFLPPLLPLGHWRLCSGPRLPRLLWTMNTLADSRPPVSTYEQAIWWLVQHLPNDQLDFGVHGLPLAAQLVADMFWTTHAQVARDFVKAYKTVNPSPCSPCRSRKGAR